MWVTLRNTLSRGRSAVPRTRLRIRYLIRCRRSSLLVTFMAYAPVFPAFFFSTSPV